MALLVRSWNVFHGNTKPPGRQSHLARMIQLATADGPDVLCLQELPTWALPRLERWSGGMIARWAVARRPWMPARLAGVITRLHQGFFRSAISGQANAILLRPPLAVREHRERQISVGRRERRVCHVVRTDGFVLGNLHASADARHRDVAAAEIRRAVTLIDDTSRDGDVCVLAGDFNLWRHELPDLPDWSEYGPGIDHVLIRGTAAAPLVVWPEERRAHGGRLLSDHAPVETTVG